MQYVVLIYQGSTPLPGTPEWETLSEAEQQQVYADYGALNQPGCDRRRADGLPEDATTVRVDDGKPLTTDGPFVETRKPSAAGSCSRPTTSTRRSTSRRRCRRPASAARSRSGRSTGTGDAIRSVRVGRRDARRLFREQWGRVVATLVGFLGDFDLAEEAAQEAFADRGRAVADRDGCPDNPRAWLMTTARNRATDRIRRNKTLVDEGCRSSLRARGSGDLDVPT